MGTQYEIVNEDKKEYMTAESLGWDSKRGINTTGRFAGLLYFTINDRWNGDKIRIIALEHWEHDDQDKFYKENKDITKEMYGLMKIEFPGYLDDE